MSETGLEGCRTLRVHMMLIPCEHCEEAFLEE